MRRHIRGRDATHVAIESAKRGPVKIEPASETGEVSAPTTAPGPTLPAPTSTELVASQPSAQRIKPPRVRKPSPANDQCLAPTADLESHRAALRETFGDTLSDEFVEVMLGQLITALRPNPFDRLDEATLNAAIALISSFKPQTELIALMAVQIAATGYAGLKFLRQSQHHMDETYIDVYGGYAIKLLRIQNELIRTLDRHHRGNRQSVEVRHVHVHPGAQGVIGIVNSPNREGDDLK